ncbi:unnamed protein product [Phytophthora lilii]|uniref:Unnamed protein product n=1 Tax=Phytophthora lilii TaxID=2077276 RepID=A0A9W7CSS4_9STRA|nr:unnamed protein product [Phytophthora lilii]
MDLIGAYLSSPSPPASPTPPDVSSGPALDTTETRRLQVARRLAGQRRAFVHQSSREEDSFQFRGYAAKRRRQNPSGPRDYECVAGEIATDSSKEVLPLFEDDEELANSLEPDATHGRMVPLRRRDRRRFLGHTAAVNELWWHPQRPHLFMSASMDSTVRMWKCPEDKESRRVLAHHSRGVKSAKWSHDGRQILSGGYDGLACCVDAESGQTQQELRRPDLTKPSASVERITTVSFHPTELSSVLLGTSQGQIYCHDLREKTPHHAITTYSKSFGDVHDLLFLGGDGQRFVSSANILEREASNQTLLVWDWRSATLLFDRLDNTMQAHSCLRAHPSRPYFVAQGNEAMLFSTKAPYKCLKGSSIDGHRPPLCFTGGHEVQGYSIKCSFSQDGTFWASGDTNGRVVIYRTARKRNLVDSFRLYGHGAACICAQFQTSFDKSILSRPSLLTGSSAGEIDLLQ